MNLDHQDDMDHTFQQFAYYLVSEIALKARQRSTYVNILIVNPTFLVAW